MSEHFNLTPKSIKQETILVRTDSGKEVTQDDQVRVKFRSAHGVNTTFQATFKHINPENYLIWLVTQENQDGRFFSVSIDDLDGYKLKEVKQFKLVIELDQKAINELYRALTYHGRFNIEHKIQEELRISLGVYRSGSGVSF